MIRDKATTPVGFRCMQRRPALRLATVDGVPVTPQRQTARLADCDGPLWSSYQRAKAAWDRARITDDPGREQIRLAAIIAHNAWAVAHGLPTIEAPRTWGFN